MLTTRTTSQKEFEVMYGSFLAGNDNKEMKKELREYIKIARHENIISKSEATKMLVKLSSFFIIFSKR